ncbi:MAG: arginine--tRNA ligase [Rhodothermales bacterium]
MKAYLARQLRLALAQITDGSDDGFDPATFDVEFQTPARPEHGDLATNAALQLARPLKQNPRKVAEALVDVLDVDPDRIAGVEIAGPGFINFRFADAYLARGVADVLAQGADYGRTDEGAGRTAIVEYVSANPTGPLTVGHGRNAVLGDTVANLLDWTGYAVTREYYFNDAGRQMRILGESVRARYEHLVRPDMPTKTLGTGDDAVTVPETFPDDGYLGGYITDIARGLYDERGDALTDAVRSDDTGPFQQAAQEAIFADIEASMQRLGIEMDTYFNERSLYDSDAVWRVVDGLREQDLAYDKDGAVWFRTGRLGKTVTTKESGEEEEKDEVLVKSSGEPTYRLPDIAYHLDKLNRGFDRIVDVFGADHIATYPDVVRGVEALGGDASKIDVLIYQFVTLVRGGEPVKMSTRKANFVTLDDLVDEVGPDVVRFFFLMLSPGTHLNFDLDLAKEAGEKNPVFYLQYAHARICSIERKAEEVGVEVTDSPEWELLSHESETALMKELLRLPEQIASAAEAMEPHRLATYLRDVATAFNQFYRDCHIVGEEPALAAARLALARATRTVLGNGLAALGISAPEQM